MMQLTNPTTLPGAASHVHVMPLLAIYSPEVRPCRPVHRILQVPIRATFVFFFRVVPGSHFES